MKLLVIPAALLALSVAALGCSSDDDDGDTAPAPTSAATRSAAQNDGPAATSAPAAQATAAGSTATVQAVSVRASERGEQYVFEVSQTTLKTGKVRVTLTNAGPERPHTFVVKKLDNSGNLAELAMIQPNATGTLEFDLTAAGTYQFQCDLRGHADRGQKGSFTVSQ